jgi:hypothetical protein
MRFEGIFFGITLAFIDLGIDLPAAPQFNVSYKWVRRSSNGSASACCKAVPTPELSPSSVPQGVFPMR